MTEEEKQEYIDFLCRDDIYKKEDFHKYTMQDFVKIKKKQGICDLKHMVDEITSHDEDGWGKNEAWVLYVDGNSRSLTDPEDEMQFIRENKAIIDEMIALGWEKPSLYDKAIDD